LNFDTHLYPSYTVRLRSVMLSGKRLSKRLFPFLPAPGKEGMGGRISNEPVTSPDREARKGAPTRCTML
jgi:hypothetical protein